MNDLIKNNESLVPNKKIIDLTLPDYESKMDADFKTLKVGFENIIKQIEETTKKIKINNQKIKDCFDNFGKNIPEPKVIRKVIIIEVKATIEEVSNG